MFLRGRGIGACQRTSCSRGWRHPRRPALGCSSDGHALPRVGPGLNQRQQTVWRRSRPGVLDGFD